MTSESDRRLNSHVNGQTLGGVPVRARDVEQTRSLHWVAWLFRAMAGVLFLLMVLQLALGLTSTVELSYGVMFADAVRLLIFAGMLWAAGELSDLFVKSHRDVRAMRILLARMEYRATHDDSPPAVGVDGEETDDVGYRH